MFFWIADNLDPPAVLRDLVALRNGVGGVVRSLSLNVGANLTDDRAHIELRKNHDGIYSGERSHNFGSFNGRHDRAAFALERAHRFIGINGDNEASAQGFRAAKIA